MSGPFQKGTKQQGPQSPVTPAQQYRKALGRVRCRLPRQIFGGKAFTELTDEQKDEVIKGLEDGSLKLDGIDSQDFFKLILNDTQTASSPIRSTAATRTWRRGK